MFRPACVGASLAALLLAMSAQPADAVIGKRFVQRLLGSLAKARGERATPAPQVAARPKPTPLAKPIGPRTYPQDPRGNLRALERALRPVQEATTARVLELFKDGRTILGFGPGVFPDRPARVRTIIESQQPDLLLDPRDPTLVKVRELARRLKRNERLSDRQRITTLLEKVREIYPADSNADYRSFLEQQGGRPFSLREAVDGSGVAGRELSYILQYGLQQMYGTDSPTVPSRVLWIETLDAMPGRTFGVLNAIGLDGTAYLINAHGHLFNWAELERETRHDAEIPIRVFNEPLLEPLSGPVKTRTSHALTTTR